MQRTCTAGTLMFLQLQTKQSFACKKKKEAKLLLSKGEDVPHFDECHRPAILGI
jgi:hypothetical protein